jgi:type II secretory pathway pseudopilin PulG
MLNLVDRLVSRKREGFTLIEVVVSSAVMMVVFVAVLGTLSTARRLSSITENRLACLHIARQYLEAYSFRGYDTPDFAVGTKQLPGNRGTCVISAVSGQNSKDVTVTVNWVEPTGMTQSVSVTSSYSRSLHR